eukprot:SAG11_NODE_25215_length_362_cov_0.619772_1_plen_41_part_10
MVRMACTPSQSALLPIAVADELVAWEGLVVELHIVKVGLVV